MELRLGLGARTTKDIDVVFRGAPREMLDALEEAIEPELVPVAIGIADFKLNGPERVACLALRYQVAQKLHAVTEQFDDRVNHRFWDLIDLQLQRELLGSDLARTREACVEIFARRDLHTWPPELVVPDDWREPYAAAASELDVDLPLDVDSAADQVRDFIATINTAG